MLWNMAWCDNTRREILRITGFSELRPSSGIPETRKHFGNYICVRPVVRGRHSLGSLWEELTTITGQPLSESELLYGCRFTASQFFLATSPLRFTTSNFIFQLNTCGYNPYVTSCLSRGWAYRLQLLLGLASTVILRSKSRTTHDHILLSQIRHSPNLEDRVPVFICPRHWVPVSSPPTARRAPVEVFDAASTRHCQLPYNYLITWDQANSQGDKRKICNKNYDKACTCVGLG
jgi:hypothetical protein